ncbi:hypothetical protein MMC08_005526 [Hypocenomyce scalaris]|nr:hypothetical protein [Hypocenomyce scalaris]
MHLGATEFLDYKHDNVDLGVKKLTAGYGAHAILCTAGSIGAYEQAVRMVRSLGTIVCIGLVRDHLPVSPFQMATRGLRVVGSVIGTAAEMQELMALEVAWDAVPIVEVFDLEKLHDLVHKLGRSEVSGRVVVRLPQ